MDACVLQHTHRLVEAIGFFLHPWMLLQLKFDCHQTFDCGAELSAAQRPITTNVHHLVSNDSRSLVGDKSKLLQRLHKPSVVSLTNMTKFADLTPILYM
jgi:hypothetical protein